MDGHIGPGASRNADPPHQRARGGAAEYWGKPCLNTSMIDWNLLMLKIKENWVEKAPPKIRDKISNIWDEPILLVFFPSTSQEQYIKSRWKMSCPKTNKKHNKVFWHKIFSGLGTISPCLCQTKTKLRLKKVFSEMWLVFGCRMQIWEWCPLHETFLLAQNDIGGRKGGVKQKFKGRARPIWQGGYDGRLSSCEPCHRAPGEWLSHKVQGARCTGDQCPRKLIRLQRILVDKSKSCGQFRSETTRKANGQIVSGQL